MTDRFETFTVLINRINRNIRKIKNREMEKYGLRSVHTTCLYYIYLNENITASRLYQKMEEDKAAVSRALEYLEENGYLVSQGTDNKKYRYPLILTDKGKQVAEEIVFRINAILNEVGLKEETRDIFIAQLSEISKNLENILK
ncbi:MAG: MarR family winged helix-turn-helix transcriptional regulator [Erysipelotrichaceae bacterium]